MKKKYVSLMDHISIKKKTYEWFHFSWTLKAFQIVYHPIIDTSCNTYFMYVCLMLTSFWVHTPWISPMTRPNPASSLQYQLQTTPLRIANISKESWVSLQVDTMARIVPNRCKHYGHWVLTLIWQICTERFVEVQIIDVAKRPSAKS